MLVKNTTSSEFPLSVYLISCNLVSKVAGREFIARVLEYRSKGSTSCKAIYI